MRCFKSARHLQRFALVHDEVTNLFMHCRYRTDAKQKRALRTQTFESWDGVTCAPMLERFADYISHPNVQYDRPSAGKHVDDASVKNVYMKEEQLDQTQTSVASDSQKKILVVLRRGLLPWQRLNVAAFTVSGVAVSDDAVGESDNDASGNMYSPMFKDPVLIFGASKEELRGAARHAREVPFSVFTGSLLGTFNDEDNRNAVLRRGFEDLDLAGMAFPTERKTGDKVRLPLRLVLYISHYL